jgi:hypothetical protein
MATIGLSGTVTKREATIMRALNRAHAERTHEKFAYCNQIGTTVFGICDGSNGEQYAVVPLVSCDCLAGRNGVMCKHVAACCDKLGRMDWLIPDFYERVILPTPDGQAAA